MDFCTVVTAHQLTLIGFVILEMIFSVRYKYTKKLSYSCDCIICSKTRVAQHDELEPNLKKKPPQKRNMRVGSYCHVVSPTNLKKI